MLQVRGAPAIGIAGFLALAVELRANPTISLQSIREKAEYLLSARPTAVNLRLAHDRVIQLTYDPNNSLQQIVHM